MIILKYDTSSNNLYLSFKNNEKIPLKISIQNNEKLMGYSIKRNKSQVPIHTLIKLPENYYQTFIYTMDEKFKENFKKDHKKIFNSMGSKYFNNYKIKKGK